MPRLWRLQSQDRSILESDDQDRMLGCCHLSTYKAHETKLIKMFADRDPVGDFAQLSTLVR